MSKFTVYKSSAGSGKTFTLVKAYLNIALSDTADPPTHYKSILAITFTNKAAGEMKARVISTLRSIADHGQEDDMGELLCLELNISSEQIMLRARRLLNAILHNYSEFSIGTIDRFVHRIIRTFALDLRLPLNFSIETNTDLVLARCVDELIRKVGEGDNLITETLVQFSRTRAEDDKNWRIENELLNFAKKLIKEEASEILTHVRNNDIQSLMEARDYMQNFNINFERRLTGRANEVNKWIKEQGLLISDFYQTNKGIGNYFNKVAQRDFSEQLYNANVKNTIESGKWRSGKSNLTEEQIAYLEIRFHEIETLRKQGLEKYLIYKALLGNIYSLMVIHELESILSKMKRDENFIFIAEFNALIAEIIRTEPIPFVYERIGEKYKHYLLDEFQDTSVLQWNNLLPLVDNALASNHFNLLVGDGKQSIYRWRGGDVNQFADLPKIQGKKNNILQERESSLIRNYCEEVLKINYRSKEEIVNFNNLFFEWLKEKIIPGEFKKVYKDCTQVPQPNRKGGFISFDNFTQPDKEHNPAIWVCEQTEHYVRLNCEKFGYNFSDITILVRTKKSGKIIADYLLSKEIPIISSETLLLHSNRSVAYLTALLALVQAERMQTEEAKVIRYLAEQATFQSTSFEKIWKEFNETGSSIWSFLLEKNQISHSRDHFAALPLFELCCLLVREFKPDKKDDLFVQFFLDEVLKYSRNNPENLSSFLDWWNENGEACSAILPLGANAVNIMTIHASKGLQFPVVIMPFADWETYKSDSIWIEVNESEVPQVSATIVNSISQLRETKYAALGNEEKEKQILDNVNLLYVANTRAEDHLHIISRNRNRSDYVDRWFNDFFSEMPQWFYTENCYHVGTMATKSGKKKQAKETLNYQLHLTEKSDLLALKMSFDVDSKKNSAQQKREDGILFHKAMSRVYFPKDALFVKGWLISQSICTREKAEEIQEIIISLMQNNNFSMFFPDGKRSMNEPELLSPYGDYRPDRILFMENNIWLIEYKTGERDKLHAQQIRNYAQLLSKLFHSPIRNFLVYVQEEKTEEIL